MPARYMMAGHFISGFADEFSPPRFRLEPQPATRTEDTSHLPLAYGLRQPARCLLLSPASRECNNDVPFRYTGCRHRAAMRATAYLTRLEIARFAAYMRAAFSD